MTEKTMNKVNFFIIGAPKCGTTSLVEYLKTHPDILFSMKKEPHYFATDLKDYKKWSDIKTFGDYLNLFCFKKGKMHGEASTTYLFSKEAVKNILQYNPAAKIIVMLRNPVDMIPAWHTQKLKDKQEIESDLRTAWNLQWKRSSGQSIPKLCTEKKMLFYKDWGLFGKQIQRLYCNVPNGQRLTIFFDDFISDTENVYKQVLDFLELNYDGKNNFPVFNKYKESRSEKIDRFRARLIILRKSNVFFRKCHKLLAKISPGRGLGIQKLFMSLNYQESNRKFLDPKFKKILIDEFHDDICLLEKLTGRDLQSWEK